MERMNQIVMGQRVEMRRWFTFWKAGWDLDKIWHTLLCSMIAQFVMEGQDPWFEILKPVERSSRTDSASAKTFRFKVSVLRILGRPFNQFVLRSVLVSSRRLRNHHGGYERDSQSPTKSFNYMLVWSSWPYWVTIYVSKAFEDSFFSRKWVSYLGLEDCGSCPSPLFGAQVFEEHDPEPEQAEKLFTHARQTFSCLREMLLYAFLWTVGPWSFCRLLHPTERERQRQ